jgi:regulator of protease activity HflC (stomatin/prohibitin superfamily)
MSNTGSMSSPNDTIVSKRGFGVLFIFGILILIIGLGTSYYIMNNYIVILILVIGVTLIIFSFIYIIKQFERSIILRFGKYHKQIGPGINYRIPFIDNVLVIDIRERVREFKAERMLTKDNVPVTIDAILRYKIIKDRTNDAILNVENFNEMIQQQASQTTLRNNIGSSMFQDILSKREEINQHIRSIISHEASNWGVEVVGVEIRQVIIPKELEAAMSKQAQAEREKKLELHIVNQRFL